ncbi:MULTISPECIES: site-2 protease family protein [Leptolyngbya]|uniref:site-2 protease family protein n=1 Tax=Leptolyngbya TaxID=47251 RepID=UPI001683CEFC|nr:site-2 protease family protein [Leptolyngbya sp. FACHB-1624]MBD1855619.1 site-2 protease family protein [Leptolyngbya sp. FACHB-1624]
MQSGWRIGSLFGIPLLIDPSWFFILVIVTLSNALRWQYRYPDWGTPVAWGTGFAMAMLLFASVLLHELGHSLVAKVQGIQVQSITLFFFGGIAAIAQEPKTPGKAFQVAIAGPAVSFMLFVILTLLTLVLPNNEMPLSILFRDLAAINLVLTLFNMIPGLPLDGGQVLKAIVWKLTGSQIKGIRTAAKVGRFLGLFAIAWGLADVLGVTRNLGLPTAGGLWAALIGWFVVQNASAYDRITELQEAMLKVKAEDAMTRDFRVVDASMSVRKFADDYLITESRAAVYYAASNGRYRGVINTEDLQRIERSEWESKTLLDIVHPLNEVPTVQESTPIVEVIQLLENQSLPRITVLSPAEAVSGVIDRGDIVKAIALKMNLRISDAAIKQIKEEGVYPPGLQLGAIAQAASELR